MAQDAVKNWREECEAIHKQMDRLARSPWPEPAAERQARRVQFMALVERRNVAARNLLRADGDRTKALDQALAARLAPADAVDRPSTLRLDRPAEELPNA